MNHKVFLIVLLITALLTGCSGGGPSTAEAKEAIYGVFLRDVRIIEKQQCELVPRMQADGETNVWLVRYKFVDSGREGTIILSEKDSKEYPWQVYIIGFDQCPAE
jgi:hypothetical protein